MIRRARPVQPLPTIGNDSSEDEEHQSQNVDEVHDLVAQLQETAFAEEIPGKDAAEDGVAVRTQGDDQLVLSLEQERKRGSRQVENSSSDESPCDEISSGAYELYSETLGYEDWVKKFQEIGNSDTDALLVTLFKEMLCSEKSDPVPFTEHLLTHINEQLLHEEFLESGAVKVARASAAQYALVLGMFERYNLTAAKMQLTSADDEIVGSAHLLPLVESHRWRKLFLEYVIERKTTHVPIADKWRNSIVLVSNAVEKQSFVALKGKFTQVVHYLKKWELPILLKRISIKMKKLSKQDADFNELLDYFTAYELMGNKYGFASVHSRLTARLEEKMGASPVDFIGYLETICASNSLKAKQLIGTLIVNNFSHICRSTIGSQQLNKRFCTILESLSGIKSYVRLDQLHRLTPEEVEMFMLFFGGESVAYLNLAADRQLVIDYSIVHDILALLSPGLKKIRIASAHFFGNEQLQLLVQSCPELEEIELIGSSITDLGCLSRLEELKVLRLPRSSRLNIESLPVLDKVVLADFSFCPISDVTPLQRLLALDQLMLQGESQIDLDALVRLESAVRSIDISGAREILFSRHGEETMPRNVVMRRAILSLRQRNELGRYYPSCEFVFGKKKTEILK